MTDQEIQKRMALLLGWKPYVLTDGSSTESSHPLWKSPDGVEVVLDKMPPWPTDDGTAIKSLEEWCRDKGYHVDLYWDEDEWSCGLARDSKPFPRRIQRNNQSLARAICDAMIAACSAVAEAHKSMEGTKHE